MSEKKRSIYNRGSRLDLPKHVDKSKYGYRWIGAESLSAASDGYEHRGWEVDKSPEGSVTRRQDLILGRMPIDMFEAMKADKEEARLNQMKHFMQKQAADEDRLTHEFKKKGGKVKFEFTQE